MVEIINPHTTEELTEWLRLVSINHQDFSADVSLEVDEIMQLFQSHELELGNLFLIRKNGIAKCAARFNPHLGIISDLSPSPGEREHCAPLIDAMIKLAREKQFNRISCWIPGHRIRVAGLLSQFTFDTRQVRFIMQLNLSDLQAKKPTESTIRKYQESDPSYHSLSPARETQVSIFELAESAKMDWTPRLVGSLDKSNLPILVAFISKHDNKRSLIRLLKESINTFYSTDLQDLIIDILYKLLDLDTGHVEMELDGDYRLIDFLKSLGFVRDRVLVELSLPLLY